MLEELGFRLINIFDLQHANDSEIQFTQRESYEESCITCLQF